MAAPVEQIRLQTIASTYGADWSKWVALFQKLSPALQEILAILLEQNNQVPMISQSGGQFDIDIAEVKPVASMFSIDHNELMSLLQTVSPAIARLILAFLKNQNLQAN